MLHFFAFVSYIFLNLFEETGNAMFVRLHVTFFKSNTNICYKILSFDKIKEKVFVDRKTTMLCL